MDNRNDGDVKANTELNILVTDARMLLNSNTEAMSQATEIRSPCLRLLYADPDD